MIKFYERDEEGRDRKLKDGDVVTIPMMMMDGRTVDGVIDAPTNATQRSAPGSLAMTDAERDRRAKLYEDRDSRVCDAWKNPPALDPAQSVRTSTPAPSADRYAARDARLEHAWRSA